MDTIHNTEGCFYKALDDEPVFTLLARDPCAAEAVRYWVTLRQAKIGSGEKPLEDHSKLGEALSTAQSMTVWRSDATDPIVWGPGGKRWQTEEVPERRLVTVAPKSDQPSGGYPIDETQWLAVKQIAMPLGNRFLIWDRNGELVLSENLNYREPHRNADWTGFYPVNHCLQRDMLWLAYEDWRNAVHHKVDALKDLIPDLVPTMARLTRRAIELGTEGPADKLLEKHLTTFTDDMPVTVEAFTLRAALAAARRSINPAEALRDIAQDTADLHGLTVDHESFDRAAEHCDTPASLADEIREWVGGKTDTSRGQALLRIAERIRNLDGPRTVNRIDTETLEAAMATPEGEKTILNLLRSNAAVLSRRIQDDIRKAPSDTLDVTDTPDMPPHRFTMFTKAKGWAYGRGLEINPAHIPDMLDRMDADGWHLQCVFGGVEPTKVGMLFKRRPRRQFILGDIDHDDGPIPMRWPASVHEMMNAPTEDDERPPRPSQDSVIELRDVSELGRQQEP